MSFPPLIHLTYQQHSPTGLLAVTSADLPGFLVTGDTYDEINDQVPAVVAAIVKARHGVDVEVLTDDVALAPGFTAAFSSHARVHETLAA